MTANELPLKAQDHASRKIDDGVSQKVNEMGIDELLAVRGEIDARIRKITAEVTAQAERLGLAVKAPKTRRGGRKSQREAEQSDA